MTKIELIPKDLEDYLSKGKKYDGEFGELPALEGKNLFEHWKKIGESICYEWEDKIERMFETKKIPHRKFEWVKKSGWTKYEKDKDPVSVQYPQENCLSFDVETSVKSGKHPTMAVAMSATCFYVWLSPFLFGGTNNHLIPFGDRTKDNLILIGHNIVAYDRSRILEEYSLGDSGIYFLDTLCLHLSVAGLSSKQRIMLKKFEKEMSDHGQSDCADEWMDVGSMNSLKDVVKKHLNLDLDKSQRDLFVEGTIQTIKNNLDSLIDYNVMDVIYTAKLAKNLWTKYKFKAPHPISRSGLFLMSKMILPTTPDRWNNYKINCESTYLKAIGEVQDSLHELALLAIEEWRKNPDKVLNDPWLRNLDWRLPGSRAKINKDKPEWYRSLRDSKTKKLVITTSKRCTPYLLKLSWQGFPVLHHPDVGWGYIVPTDSDHIDYSQPYQMDNEMNLILDEDFVPKEFTKKDREWLNPKYLFYKIPHKDGEKANLGNPLSKNYIREVENETLTSCYELGKQAIRTAVSCSYWVSIRKRVNNQLVIYPSNIRLPNLRLNGEEVSSPSAVIIPSFLPIGTASGRATENLWLTASNPKAQKLGSELKATLLAPKNMVFAGGDIASEEAWLAAMFGDSYEQGLLPGTSTLERTKMFKGANCRLKGKAGVTPFSEQVLIGNKRDGTDIHTFTVSVVRDKAIELFKKEADITRDDSKVLNYCVPLSAQALTTSGWKYHHEIKEGDIVMGYNPQTDKQEWTVVEHIPFFEGVQTYRLNNDRDKKFNHVATANHSWYGDVRRTKNGIRYNNPESFKTADIKSEHRIYQSAPCRLEDRTSANVEQVKILAWIATDGHMSCTPMKKSKKVKGGNKRYLNVSIAQSQRTNPENVEEIFTLLNKLNLSYATDHREDGLVIFRLHSSDKLRDFFRVNGIDPENPDYVKYVLKLGDIKLRNFFDVCFKAEGWYDQKTKVVSQNEGSLLDAMHLAGHLLGYGTSKRFKQITSSGKNHYCLNFAKERIVTGQRLKITPEKKEDVWCLTTSLGTWVMRQGDCITITGNSRYYGSGVRSTSLDIRKFDKRLSLKQTYQLAKELFSSTKGKKVFNQEYGKKVWSGGTESSMFNALEDISTREVPRTPVLLRALSDALLPRYDKRNSYTTSRINWCVQSSGVDFLHLMICGLDYLIKKYNLIARLCITIHDELRYVVEQSHIKKFAWCMNVVHLWTRAFISYRLGIKDIPVSIIWFDQIDIDHTLRKEVYLDCVTPSNPNPEAVGYGYTMEVDPPQPKSHLVLGILAEDNEQKAISVG